MAKEQTTFETHVSTGQLPDEPPFSCFVANMAYEVNEEQLASFFSAFTVTGVKIIRDFAKKSRGMGYVDFESRDMLAEALKLNGSSLEGRAIKISLPERREERAPSRADSASSWRTGSAREGPTNVSQADSSSNWRSDRTFTPMERSAADTATSWRSQKHFEPEMDANSDRDWRSTAAKNQPVYEPPKVLDWSSIRKERTIIDKKPNASDGPWRKSASQTASRSKPSSGGW